jgi:hypothetical protein
VTTDIWNAISSQFFYLQDPMSLRDLMSLRRTCWHLYTHCIGAPQWAELLKELFPGSYAEAPSPKDYPQICSQGGMEIHYLKNLSLTLSSLLYSEQSMFITGYALL